MRFRALLLTMWLAGGCATGSAARPSPYVFHSTPPPPVLLVHGMHDTADGFGPLRTHLEAAGWPVVRTVSLEPNNGSVSVPEMARQVARAAAALRVETGATRIDVVGFSMGALVTRFWVQWLGGRDEVRRFVSISGPQSGTLMAYLLPGAGVKQMRPHSRLLRALNLDPHPWGEVEVFSFWTPMDLIIVPPSSSQLPDATERTFPVLLHHWMLQDKRVLDAVVEVLGAPETPR
ncbi:lipase family alpha/beta hydrolase [Hyalangium gracile]|uniref:lipase family alpha/beta hydrolase n=1 Tax=Hyalangium gracile TaxID=394092 RepID=UPI001CCBA3AA|nr:lipase [Hyalangium gracile]